MSDLRKAIFLDRDGTINEDVGFLKDPSDIHLLPGTIDALLKLQKKYLLFVITNQSGIAKGLMSMEEVMQVNEKLNEMLSEKGIFIEQWYVCPHNREDNCSCIKPKPYFVLKAKKDYGLNLNESFVIGDHFHDTMTAREQGLFGLYLLTGHGGRHLCDLPSDILIFHRLSDAAEWIMQHEDPKAALLQQIEKGASIISNGGVVAFPTETVYGLGADAFLPEAVARLFEIKGRPLYNPLIVHISDYDQLYQVAATVPEEALRLTQKYWPGPLTIVLPKRKEIPDIVTGGEKTVAIRMPSNPIALDLIRKSGTPIAAPSANAFSCTSPTTALHVKEQLGNQCDLIIDGGACRIGVESTVVSFVSSRPIVLRPGGISFEDIQRAVSDLQQTDSSKKENAQSPGMLPNHYAPKTPISAFTEIPKCYEDKTDVGILLFQPSEQSFAGTVEVLSRLGNENEAAANFYAAIRRLDALKLKEIVAQFAPPRGVGLAINNRLSKAVKGRVEK